MWAKSQHSGCTFIHALNSTWCHRSSALSFTCNKDKSGLFNYHVVQLWVGARNLLQKRSEAFWFMLGLHSLTSACYMSIITKRQNVMIYIDAANFQEWLGNAYQSVALMDVCHKSLLEIVVFPAIDICLWDGGFGDARCFRLGRDTEKNNEIGSLIAGCANLNAVIIISTRLCQIMIN